MKVAVLIAIGYLAAVAVIAGQFWWNYWFVLTPEQRKKERARYIEDDEHI